VGGDQLSLLSRGWLLAERSELVPYGNPLSGGGYGPGPMTSVVVGAPLALWSHHRAPIVLIWLTHLAAWALLDSRLKRLLSPGERAAFALVYWLNPWRMSSAAILWNPNYLFLAGAIHFVTAFDQRERPRAWSSFVHVLTLGLAVQLHPSVLLLGVASLVLVIRRSVRVHWPAAIAGGVAALLTLWPWIALVRERPELLRGDGEGFLFRAIALVQPWIKGLSYWLRYPSFLLPEASAAFDFTAAFGPGTDRWLSPALAAAVLVLGLATVAVAIVANVAFARSRRRAGWIPAGPVGASGGREFLERYVVAGALAAVVVIAASPTTPQSWQVVPLFHVVVLPVAFWLGARFPGSAGRRFRVGAVAAAAVSVLLCLAMAFGARNFRCGGRDPMVYPLLADSPMLEALHLHDACRWPTNVAGGGWPDGMPRN
jgi:hypothetical protein